MLCDKRMYATGGSQCPVESLRNFLQRTDSQAQSLFNHCSKEALTSPETTDIWYSAKPCKPYQFTKFMPDISRNAGCSRNYTAHCLRSTCIQTLNDEGFEIRHIMYMSGHRNEASVRAYNRDCSTSQKHQLSSALQRVAQPTSTATTPHQPKVQGDHSSSSVGAPTTSLTANLSSNTTQHSSFSSFISNSAFSQCTFNFSSNPFHQ